MRPITIRSLAATASLLPVVCAIVGCGQGGRFVTTGVDSQGLLTPVGCVDIVTGNENGSADASDRHLLYLLILTPGLRELGSSSFSDYGKYVTTLKDQWDTEKGSFAVTLSWDRTRDVVTIGDREFDRSAGDVFVVAVDTNGAASGEQLPTLGAPSGASGLLHYIQKQLPNDKRISSIVLR